MTVVVTVTVTPAHGMTELMMADAAMEPTVANRKLTRERLHPYRLEADSSTRDMAQSL